MAVSSKTPPHQSKDPQKFKPRPSASFPRSSPLCHHTKNAKKKRWLNEKERGPKNREGSWFPGRVARKFTKISIAKPQEKEKITQHLGSVNPSGLTS
ncbi:hypothetical protein TNCV_54031 [Trichonephila clavipes]|nr:hypothetical protein TNCV_54031 [Trichonephila clavipes]